MLSNEYDQSTPVRFHGRCKTVREICSIMFFLDQNDLRPC